MGTARTRQRPNAITVRSRVVGIRSSTSGRAGARWKNDLPKSPRATLPTKRTNCTPSESLNPIASRSATRSASGASGIMSATGSPLAWRMANVTRDTPARTTARRTTRRAMRVSTAPPYRLPGTPALFLGLGVEQPQPLVPAGRVLHPLGDAEGVVLRPQVDVRCLLADELLDLRVGALPLGLIDRRAPLVDEAIEALHARVPLADPASGLRVIERMEDGVGVEDGVVAPVAVVAVGGLAFGLEELVPGRTRIPHLGRGADAHL